MPLSGGEAVVDVHVYNNNLHLELHECLQK